MSSHMHILLLQIKKNKNVLRAEWSRLKFCSLLYLLGLKKLFAYPEFKHLILRWLLSSQGN